MPSTRTGVCQVYVVPLTTRVPKLVHSGSVPVAAATVAYQPLGVPALAAGVAGCEALRIYIWVVPSPVSPLTPSLDLFKLNSLVIVFAFAVPLLIVAVNTATAVFVLSALIVITPAALIVQSLATVLPL